MPISIPPFSNVPAPGDGVTSAWAQQLTQFAVDHAYSRNRIINGAFAVNQRGVALNAGGYSSDRWNGFQSGAVSPLFGPTAANMGGVIGPEAEELRHYYGMSGTLSNPAGSGYIFTQTNIEDVRTLAGQTATLSFWAKADTPGTMGIRFQQAFDNAGVGDNEQQRSIPIDAVWTRRVVTVALPSTAGKTIGPNSFLGVKLDKLMGTGLGLVGNITGPLYIAGLQLEAGNVPTAFEHRPYGDELARCQRYFFAAATMFGIVGSNGRAIFPGSLPVMRTTPTVMVGTLGNAESGATLATNIAGVLAGVSFYVGAFAAYSPAALHVQAANVAASAEL